VLQSKQILCHQSSSVKYPIGQEFFIPVWNRFAILKIEIISSKMTGFLKGNT